ncbi:MAG: hypothetical protein EAX81_05985 [Candidatus Thorarchaeota archaeon]|nr:hypothetical protein [Candidatus Thorarchaeota archaeon]
MPFSPLLPCHRAIPSRKKASVPSYAPEKGWKWMPTETGSKLNPREFIEVPLNVDSYKDVEKVINQLKPLNDNQIRELKKRLGNLTQTEAFMYALGSLVSDGTSQQANDSTLSSSRLNIGLGKSYTWSENYGDATCLALGMIGIRAGRIRGEPPKVSSSLIESSGKHRWQSQYSPLINWMRNHALGLKPSELKTYDSIRASWILEAPESWKIPFLQGVCDGDGCASVASQYLSIGTSANTEFFQDLLESMNIKSHEGDGAVAITSHESMKRAAEIGIFRYATGRKENLIKLDSMMRTYDNSRELRSAEIAIVKEMRGQGKSWGKIAEELFDLFGYT